MACLTSVIVARSLCCIAVACVVISSSGISFAGDWSIGTLVSCERGAVGGEAFTFFL